MGAVLDRTLRILHESPVTDCPFDGRLPTVLEHAGTNVRNGLVMPEVSRESAEVTLLFATLQRPVIPIRMKSQ
jgi:aminoglycoside phosphotransferase